MASITKNVMVMVEEIKNVFRNLNGRPQEVNDLLKRCKLYIQRSRSVYKMTSNVGTKRCLQRCIAELKGFKVKLHSLLHHGRGNNSQRTSRKSRVVWEDIESAFENRIRTGAIINIVHKDPKIFLEDCQYLLSRRVKNILKKYNLIKINTTFCGEFKIIQKDEEIFEYKYFNTKNVIVDHSTDLKKWFSEYIQQKILAQLEEFQERDSGWALSSIINLAVNINKYEPFRGSSYIDLPPEIKRKHACINVKNTDSACFAWAIVSALYPAEHNSDRVSSYPHYNQILNLDGISLPPALNEIPRFEKLNTISVNIFILEKRKKNFQTVPAFLTRDKQEIHVNLLMIQDYYDDDDDDENDYNGEEEDSSFEIKYHYCWIKELSRLVSHQTKKNGRKHICDRCLHWFWSEEKLAAHIDECMKMNNCKIILPTEHNKWLTFKNFNFKETVPFIIYADFECLLKPEDIDGVRKTTTYQKHEAYSVGYYFNCSFNNNLSYFRSYRGVDCQHWFTNQLQEILRKVEDIFSQNILMNTLTEEEKVHFIEASCCHICEKPFSVGAKRVRDHCHLTGKYRGPAHEECNLNYQDTRIIPVVFHNLSGYDAHFVIKEIATAFEGRVDLLPINKERYISFTKNVRGIEVKFRFIDSFRFMASYLDKLTSYLPKEKLLITRKEWNNLNSTEFELVTRKGVFPYDYINDWGKLNEKALPSQLDFYCQLNESYITDDDYLHAQNVWKTFHVQTLGEYSDLYLKTDVLLLSDIFENFRNVCAKTYGLDPAHYFTLPGLTWDAMLKYTQIKLELLTDIEMVLFIEKGIRGGISQCSNRYSKANNRYMTNYNDQEDSKYLMYFDVNNLYGWAMSQYLPTHDFKWVNTDIDITKVSNKSPIGFILEVDLEYPEYLHDKHSDLPFCATHEVPPESKQEKLMATLHNKEKYIIHYQNLKQCLAHGLILRKIHRVLQFNQFPWLKQYIDLNTEMRKKAENEFERNKYKLMNNAVYGKTMENVRKHCLQNGRVDMELQL